MISEHVGRRVFRHHGPVDVVEHQELHPASSRVKPRTNRDQSVGRPLHLSLGQVLAGQVGAVQHHRSHSLSCCLPSDRKIERSG